MADPTRVVAKGEGITPFPIRPRAEQHSDFAETLQMTTGHPTKPGFVDLRLLRNGLSADDIAADPMRWKRGTVPFRGRPQLIRQLAPYLEVKLANAPESTVETTRQALYWWWRRLDTVDHISPVDCVEDFNDIHYHAYRMDPSDKKTANNFLSRIAEARTAMGLPNAFWSGVDKGSPKRDLISDEHVKLVYEFYKRIAFTAIQRYELDPAALPRKTEVVAFFTIFMLQSGWNAQVMCDIDMETMNADGTFKCIVPHPMSPSSHVIIKSTKDRANGTIQTHASRIKPQLSAYNIIKLLYERSEPLRAMYRAELAMVTERLHKVGALLASGKDENGSAVDTDECQKLKHVQSRLILDQGRLQRCIQSPWTFERWTNGSAGKGVAGTLLDHSHVKAGALLKGVTGTYAGASPTRWAAHHINLTLKPGEKPIPVDFQLSDLRDAFLVWRYVKSRYSWLDAFIAAGHNNIDSLRNYLNAVRLRAQSFKDFTHLTNEMLSVIQSEPNHRINLHLPTVIAAKMAKVPEEKILLWIKGKELTYCGTGCANIQNPPSHIAPDHSLGRPCLVQRCTLCKENAILLPNSWYHLAKRLAELRYIRSTLPMDSWSNSSFSEEMGNTEDALSQYDESKVAAALQEWESAIAEGRHQPMTLESSYA